MKKGLCKYILAHLVLSWCFLWFFANASWVSDACENSQSCENLPGTWYNQPYCISDDVDNSSCVLLWLTNAWSLISVNDVKTIIEKYCKQSLWLDKRQWRIYYAKVMSGYDWWDWKQTFDSNQSLFVYALCSSFYDGQDRPFLSGWSDILSGVFNWEDVAKILKLQQVSNNKDNCSLEDDASLNNCDMSLYATEIFSSIMSEIFKIWYAQIFNVNTVQDYEINQTKIIVSFLSWYYNITEDYDKVRNRFPQTINVLKSNQLFYKKVLDKLKLINNSELAGMVVDDEGCPDTWDIRWLRYLACALHESEWKWVALSRSFLTMCYNELLNYRFFVSFYSQMLEKMSEGKETTEKLIIETQVLDLKNYSDKQIAAFRQTLSDMEGLNMTYPLHIGLLLYQERVKNFRDNYLSPLVTLLVVHSAPT